MHCMSLELVEVSPKMRCYVRAGTSDMKALQEVTKKRVYDLSKQVDEKRKLPSGMVWCDCGANIGAFALWALLENGSPKVYAFEPEEENCRLLEVNLYLNDCDKQVELFRQPVSWKSESYDLYMAKDPNNKWRHTILPVKRRTSLPGRMNTVGLQDFLKQHADVTAVKMDIEGSEAKIIEGVTDWCNVQYLVFEWHFDRKDDVGKLSALSRFKAAMENLRKHFQVVSHRVIPENETHWRWYPPATVVVCQRMIL